MSSKASPTVVMSFNSSSATSISKVSSNAMTSSTRSRLSAPRSSLKEASRVTLDGSTANTSTALSVNFASASLRSMVFAPCFVSLHGTKPARTVVPLLAEREPAVNAQHGAGDVAGVATREKPHHASDIGRLADAPHGDHGGHLVLGGAHIAGHVGIDETGRDDVHGHAARGDLFGEGAGESDQSCFGGRVVRLTRYADEGTDGADEDDRALSGPHHGRHRRSHGIKSAVEVGRQHFAPLFVTHAHREAVASDARVENRDVDRSELGDCGFHRLGDLLGVRDVDPERFGATAWGVAGPRQTDDAVAQLNEVFGDSGADAAARAGDDDVSTHGALSFNSSSDAGAYWCSKGRMRLVRPLSTPPGGISIVVVTDAGSAIVQRRNSTGDVSWRESRLRHSEALVCTSPSTLASNVASVAPHVVDASAVSSSAWADAINGEWKAPPTGSAVARRQPSSRCRAIRSSRPSVVPLTTIWPVPLMLAIHTSARSSNASRAWPSPPIRATIDPGEACAARAIAAPRTAINRAPSSMLNSPDATRAVSSPRLWPRRKRARTPRSSSSR